MRQQRRAPRIVEPAPPSLLWATWTDGVLIECITRLFVSGIWVEVRIDGAPAVGRTFTRSEEAAAFAGQQRRVWAEPRDAGRTSR